MASLASRLFSTKSKDSGLDDIFRTSAGTSKIALAPPVAHPADSSSKRKAQDIAANVPKRAKHDKVSSKKSAPPPASSDDDSDDSPPRKGKQAVSATKLKKAKKAALPAPSSSSEAEDAGAGDASGSEDSEDDAADAPPPKHISLLGAEAEAEATGSRKKKKTAFTPADETPAQRDARTVFIGNLPIDVAKSKAAKKQLTRHLASAVPGSKVESIRFRSVAFQNPTSTLPKSDDEDDATSSKKPKQTSKSKPDEPSTKEKRSNERAASWRDSNGNSNGNKKQYLTPAEKKKIAFIHKEFHADADTTNAYAVFAYPDPSAQDAVSPDEVARRVVEECDGTQFMERTIRVDRVGTLKQAAQTDPKRSVFVGSLDFAAKEEDLRVFFESLLTTERGPVPETGAGENKSASWVTHVRLVRDPATQLGKGFAYVEFADRECVDEVLALEPVRLKFAKRKLRVQRCKTNPTVSVSAKPSRPSSSSGSAKKLILDPTPFVSLPARDHTKRAAELAALPKDERKAAKAADEARLARRMAKKQQRHALGPGAQSGSGGKGLLGKRRTDAGKSKVNKGTAKKGRVRSEAAVARRNAKK
ncbi:hypothetical protein EXIGLDRAFT_839379 [Exidia glandulosa HHB12029]|uniref:Nucleolar protein 12 n=1 Tax=Exidia glandulosa HHB12029 TaxID=1314781 RepID=A0A165F311_EXIGL|nr:hypothetical protein EXIGLDRAFT_839379 [Exidia glandulosa HHB12029]